MGISDWSSDVCSSELTRDAQDARDGGRAPGAARRRPCRAQPGRPARGAAAPRRDAGGTGGGAGGGSGRAAERHLPHGPGAPLLPPLIARPSCRASVFPSLYIPVVFFLFIYIFI